MADSRLIPAGIQDASTLAFNELIDRLGQIQLDQLLINLVDNVTAGALPHLAEQFHITGLEGWSLCTTDDERRSLIKRAIWLHRKKGTPWAVKEGLKGVGYGGAAISERQPALNYNGSEIFSGAEGYGAGANWARFRILLDLGENRGVSTSETDLIRAVVNEWKNERSHLDAITFAVSTSDTTAISEATTITARDIQPDVLPWGIRYDGSVLHNSGRNLFFDGADTYAGGVHYNVSVDGSITYQNNWESDSTLLHATESDQQQSAIKFDGLAGYDGQFDQGATPPPVYDTCMTVTTKRHNIFSGLRHYGSDSTYNGSACADGTHSYSVMAYAGIHTIQEIEI